MNDKVVKPITVVKDEFISELVSLINSSQLPLFVVEYIIKDILSEVHATAVKQGQEDSIKYSKQLEDTKKKD